MQCPSCGTWYAKAQAFCFCCGAILTDGKHKAQLGSYQLLEKIGQGGMGIVYRSFDESLHRDVAIKVLHQHMLGNPKQVERFRREARMQGQIMHPNIVALLDVYEDNDIMALVLELVQGCTLKEYLICKEIPDWSEIHYIANGILAGLEVAHEKGVVHRDLKPSNVFLNDDGIVKLMDFGLAKPKTGKDDITATGDMVGTYHYMAPEQIIGQELSTRTDLYALGILLYRMCTGLLPFTSSGGGEFEIMEKQVRHDPIPPRKVNGKIPRAMVSIITSLMEKKPEDRPEDCDAVRAMLTELGEPKKPGIPEGSGGEHFESYSQFSVSLNQNQKEIDGENEEKASETSIDDTDAIPAHCLLWSFKVTSELAPDEPPLDLSSPPRIERNTLERLRTAINHIAPLPEVWHQVETLLADPHTAPYDLAKIIDQDPVLTSHVLKWSNSAAYSTSSSKPMTDVALAITRIGMDAAHDLILQALVPEIGDKENNSSPEVLRVWFHSQAIALFTRTLAEHAQVMDRRSASMLGLLHDIGKLIILHIEDEPTLQKIREGILEGTASLKAEWNVLGYTHIDAGMMLALHWKLPRSIHRFIYFHHHPCWHQPDIWPMDVQPSIMLGHMAHLALQSMEEEPDTQGIWTASRRTHVEGTESLLRRPLCLPLTDARLYSQLKQELSHLKTMFPELYPVKQEAA